MKECEFCGQEGQMFDGVVEGRPVDICQGCIGLHKAVILNKPSVEKIKDVERMFTVRERLEEGAKLRELQKSRRDKEIKEKAAFPETTSHKLKTLRENKGMSQLVLAEALGVSVEVIKSIEGGTVPGEKLLRQYEQLFKSKLQQDPEEEEISAPNEKVTFTSLLEKARTFFRSSKVENNETDDGEVEVKI